MTDHDAPTESDIQPRSVIVTLLRPVVIGPALILAMIVAAPIVYRSMQFAGIPPIEPIVDPEVDGRVVIPEAENAFTFYRQAVPLLPPSAGTVDVSVGNEAIAIGQGWKAVPPDVRDSLDSSKAALAMWKQGTELDEAHYIDVADMDYSTVLPMTQELRTFARLATLQMLRCLEEGKTEEAWDRLRAILKSGRHSGMHGITIERLVGIAIHTMASRAIVHWAAHDTVTIEQLRRAADEVQEIYRLTPATSKTLKAEAICTTNVLENPVELREALSGLVKSKLLLNAVLFVKGEPELGRDISRHVFANYLSQCDNRPSERDTTSGRREFYRPTGKEVPPIMSPTQLEPALQRSMAAMWLLPAISQIITSCDREHALQDALELCLFVEMYRRKHGRYPETLAALVPEFVAEVPADWMGSSSTDRMLMIRSEFEISPIDSAIDEPESEPPVKRPCLVIYSRGRDHTDGGGDLDSGNDTGLRILLPLIDNQQP